MEAVGIWTKDNRCPVCGTDAPKVGESINCPKCGVRLFWLAPILDGAKITVFNKFAEKEEEE